jgi:hypothetical protein
MSKDFLRITHAQCRYAVQFFKTRDLIRLWKDIIKFKNENKILNIDTVYDIERRQSIVEFELGRRIDFNATQDDEDKAREEKALQKRRKYF